MSIFQRMNTVVFTTVLAVSSLSAAVVSVGKGSYLDGLPAGAVGPCDVIGDQPGGPISPAITPNISGAIPTNDWCSSLSFHRYRGKEFPERMYPHPLGVECNSDGIAIGYGDVTYSGEDYYINAVPLDLTIGQAGKSASKVLLDDYSDWTVTAWWEGIDMRATFGHGLPYVYCELPSPQATISTAGVPQVWYDRDGVLGISIGTRHYGLFAPNGSSWSVENQTISSTLNGKSYLSAAVLPDNSESTIEEFAAHAFAFVTDTKVNWYYDKSNSTAEATFSYTTEIKEGTESAPLSALYLHQWKNSDNAFLPYQYNSPRGIMKVVDGMEFATTHIVPGVLPVLPFPEGGTFNRETLQSRLNEILQLSDEQLIRVNADTYWTGKDLGRAAQLLHIANQLGDDTAKNRLLSLLKSRLEDWFTAEESETKELFAHNSEWGSLIGFGESYGSEKELNDHHFHYGYFIMASAAVALYDHDWAKAENWGGMVETIIREVANCSRNDDFSPFLRTFDPYAGHSWAAGHAAFADGNNQESTSESLNFSAGTLLWAQITGNDSLLSQSAWMYATEVDAFQRYWMDVNHEVFPDDFPKSALGMVWSSKGSHSTWFTAEPEMIHGINMLPMTAASLYYGNYPDYVQENYQEILNETGNNLEQWRDILVEYYAFADPAAAIATYENFGTVPSEEGESAAHTYHHLHSLNRLGTVVPDVHGSVASSICFEKNGQRYYVIHNTDEREQTITFSDGARFEVPADSLVVLTESQTVATTAILQGTTTFIISGNRITATLPQSGSISYRLYTPAGKLVEQQKGLNLSAGTTHIAVGTTLGRGVYIAELQAEGVRITERIFR